MSYDYEKLENKKNEIIGIVHELFTENDKTAISLVDSFCRLTPPEKEKICNGVYYSQLIRSTWWKIKKVR